MPASTVTLTVNNDGIKMILYILSKFWKSSDFVINITEFGPCGGGGPPWGGLCGGGLPGGRMPSNPVDAKGPSYFGFFDRVA